MITLPEKYTEYNNKSRSTPAVVVEIGRGKLENIQTTQGDWEDNSAESDVDYATFPGDVVLSSSGTTPSISQGSQDSLYEIHGQSLGVTYNNSAYQSFLTSIDDFNITLGTVTLYYQGGSGSTTNYLYCSVNTDRTAGSQIGNYITYSTSGIAVVPTAHNFDFSAQNIVLTPNTTYYIRFWASNSLSALIYLVYNSAGGYADGQLDIIGTQSADDIGDAYFNISFAAEQYVASGSITTQIIDLGETPAVDGEWLFADRTPNIYGTQAIEYHAYGSTDNFSGSNVDLGVVEDGDPIETGDWYRYYKVAAALTTTAQAASPIIQSIGLRFFEYDYYSNRDIFGFEAGVDSISSLTTAIDDFDLQTVGQMSITLGLTEKLSDYLASIYYRNKPVNIKLGFVGDDFAYSDFIRFYSGIIIDCTISSDSWVTLTIQDDSATWKIDVPRDETAVAGEYAAGSYTDIVATADHPISVMLDIMQDQLDVRDSKIDFATFTAVETDLSGWEVTRTIDGDSQESADELLNQLRVLTSTYFIPDASGKIRLKQYDSAEAAVDTWTDDTFLTAPKFESNIKKLYNKTFIKFDVTAGTETYNHVYIGLDSTSISNYEITETFELEDKWTLTADVAQIEALTTFILGRYGNPPRMLKGCKVDRKHIAKEVGDVVTVSTFNAPSTDFGGIDSVKFQIVKKNFDPIKHNITFDLLEL